MNYLNTYATISTHYSDRMMEQQAPSIQWEAINYCILIIFILSLHDQPFKIWYIFLVLTINLKHRLFNHKHINVFIN